MSPDSFNRLQNTSKEDFDRFVAWLFRHTLNEARTARDNADETRAVWIRYFQRGLKADLLLGELMDLLPELFSRINYSAEEAPRVLAMLKGLNFDDMGIHRTKAGVEFDGNIA